MWSAFSNLSFKTKGLILMAVPITIELIFVSILTIYILKEADRFKKVQESKVLIRLIQRSHSAITRAFLIYSYSPRTQTIRAGEAEKIAEEIKKQDRWEQRVKLENVGPELASLAKEVRTMRGTALALTEDLKQAASEAKDDQRMYRLAFSYMPAITEAKDIYRRLLEKESRMKQEIPDREKKKRELLTLITVGLFSGIGISATLLYLFTRSFISRLNQTAARARAIAIGMPAGSLSRGSDEIAELDKALYNAAVNLQELKERQSAIRDGAGDLILILSLDARLRVKTIGEVCQKHWGFSSEILIGKSILTLLNPELREETSRTFDSIIHGGIKQVNLETRIAKPDGSTGIFSWMVRWSKSKETFFCVVRDVSEARRIEKLRQYFLSMAGHDLRSPLTAISMDLQMILAGVRGPVPAPVAAKVEEMDRELSRLIGYVNELLDLEKLEAHSAPLSTGAASAAALCEAAIESLGARLEQTGTTILLPSNDLLLNADETKLEKALEAMLASCARLASGAAKLQIKLKKQGDSGVISLTVPGLNIAEAEREEIFDKLRPASPTLDSGQAPGPGLGLAIARAVAVMHGGSATMSNGATFNLSIPLYKDDQDYMNSKEGPDDSAMPTAEGRAP